MKSHHQSERGAGRRDTTDPSRSAPPTESDRTMHNGADRLIEIFNDAKALSPGVEREAFLARVCGDDSTLKDQLWGLLEAHAEAGDFLAPPALLLPPDDPLTEKPGDMIGRYKLLEQIGEGGGGVVYMAEQVEPVRRRVALKIIKLGMDTKNVIARFEAERQTLAMMEHPNIARVFDGGATDTGRPYFVMELVRGTRVTEYCDRNDLSTEARLGLFMQVCGAIQHAHQKGIIHRDIKPSNILVTVNDGVAVPKVIDFGIAKAIEQRLTDKTMFTAFEQFIGTPAYMSPEQAEMTSLDIDTRADIYALGVLLYELLTGGTPFDSDELIAAGVAEIRRIIREEEPPRPSSRLTSLTEPELSTVAARRHTEPPKLIHNLRGDLDWIVMKCLEKDRGRRYDSASALVADLDRHLKGEAVLACPPSAAYRLRKFARRNRSALVMASVLALSVLVALATLAVSNVRVARERDEKAAALADAVAEKARADRNLARAREAVKEYLLKTSEHPLLQSGDFHDLRKELLETAVPFYEEFVRQDHEDPELELERGLAYDDLGFLRDAIGDQERALADLERAEAIYRRLATRFPGDARYRLRLAEALNTRGGILNELGRLDAAEVEFREALAVAALLRSGSAAAAEALESEARIQSNYGLFLKDSGRLPEAEGMLREAVATREALLAREPAMLRRRGQLATSLNNLGTLLTAQRKVPEAEGAFERMLEILAPETIEQSIDNSLQRSKVQHLRAQAWNNLGSMRNAGGRTADAEEAFREAMAIKRALAEQFPSIPQYRQELAGSLNNLGTVTSSLGRPEDARTAYEEAIRIYERLAAEFPANPRYVVTLAGTCSNLGRLIGDEGDLEASLPWVTKGIEILEEAMGRDPRVAKVRESLCIASWTRAMTLAGLDRYPEALQDWDRAIEVDDGRYARTLRLKRASNLLHLADLKRAIADAKEVADAPGVSADDLYDAACVHALAARMVPEAATADSYAAQAVGLLRRAVANGFHDAEHLKADADLEALRVREDFQQLSKELDQRPQGGKGKGAE